MATNIRMGAVGAPIGIVDLVVTVSPHTTSPLSGDPVLCGFIPGVAEADKEPVTGLTPVNVHCVAEFVVKGITTGGGNGAVSAGDRIYMQTDGTLDKNSTGTGAVIFGTAFGNTLDGAANKTGVDTRTGQLVASGATTTTIRVWVGKVN